MCAQTTPRRITSTRTIKDRSLSSLYWVGDDVSDLLPWRPWWSGPLYVTTTTGLSVIIAHKFQALLRLRSGVLSWPAYCALIPWTYSRNKKRARNSFTGTRDTIPAAVKVKTRRGRRSEQPMDEEGLHLPFCAAIVCLPSIQAATYTASDCSNKKASFSSNTIRPLVEIKHV